MGDRLKQALDARKMTPADLVRRLGVSKGTIYNIVSDKTGPETVTFETVHKICRALRLDPEWLVYERGQPPSEQLALPPPAPNEEAVVTGVETLQTVTQALVNLALRHTRGAASELLASLASDMSALDNLNKDQWGSDILDQLRQAVRATAGTPPSAPAA